MSDDVMLTAQHIAVMRAIAAGKNPQIFPMMRKFLRKHDLIIPIAPPRAIRTMPGRQRAPAPREHALTDEGARVLAAHAGAP